MLNDFQESTFANANFGQRKHRVKLRKITKEWLLISRGTSLSLQIKGSIIMGDSLCRRSEVQ